MKDQNDLSNKYIKYLTEKGKPCYIESDKQIMHFSQKNSKGDLTYRCKHYKDKLIKCKAFFNLDINEKIISYNDNHICIMDLL